MTHKGAEDDATLLYESTSYLMYSNLDEVDPARPMLWGILGSRMPSDGTTIPRRM